LKDLVAESTKLSGEFVSSDAQKVKAQAEVVMTTLDKMDRKLLDEQGNGLWMEGVMVVAHMLQKIRESDDIEVQRKAFAVYNNSLFFLAKAFGIADQQVYYQYCPMAFDNQGAYWMSSIQEILNPYFGDKMLHCGSNKDGINVEIKKEDAKI
jgi:Cu(I)/Ag(I) efflux system membrane fusion protein